LREGERSAATTTASPPGGGTKMPRVDVMNTHRLCSSTFGLISQFKETERPRQLWLKRGLEESIEPRSAHPQDRRSTLQHAQHIAGVERNFILLIYRGLEFWSILGCRLPLKSISPNWSVPDCPPGYERNVGVQHPTREGETDDRNAEADSHTTWGIY
jgi:hypothetical protein